MLLTPANFPELEAAAERYHAAVKVAKAAGLDPMALRMAIRRAGWAYLEVFNGVSREVALAREKPAAGDDSCGGSKF
jgi:hypothetical protein